MSALYPDSISKLFNDLQKENSAIVARLAELTCETIDQGGLVYVFGSGHSSILAEEAFHRAGGLIPIYPILYDFLSPHLSPKISGKMERIEGVAEILFKRAGATSRDLIWIASNSGINAAAIEMAQVASSVGTKSIALTNLKHSRQVQSRHSSGKRLFELCDFVLDNCCPTGDALASVGGVKVAPGSTLANCFLYNWVLTAACELWAAKGKTLPVYQSANTPGGDAHNEKAEASYRSRIPLL